MTRRRCQHHLPHLPLAFALLLAAAPCFAEHVGHANDGTLITPVNQIVTPAGTLIELPGTRPQTLALSPDGKILAVAGLATELTILDPATGKILQHVPFPADKNTAQAAVSEQILNPKSRGVMSVNGLVFSPDGTRVYLSSASGEIKIFSIAPGGAVAPLRSIWLPFARAPERKEEIPAGIAVSRDGKKLYVALNLSNRLAEIDIASNKVLRAWDTGVAPFDVVIAKNKIYVSNWGGPRPDAVDSGLRTPDSGAAADATDADGAPAPPAFSTGPAGRGMTVRVDARGIASEGSITIIDPAQTSPGAAQKEIPVGRHASALALSPDQRWLVAAATGDDTLHVIDTRTGEPVEKICARPSPSDLFGAQPCALAFAPDGKTLYSANGTQNAIAVFHFDPADKESAFLGLIPAGWFPAAIAFDARRNQLCVANIKDIAARPEKAGQGAQGAGYNSKQYCGTLSLIPVPPAQKDLDAHTQRALANLRHVLLAQAALPPRPGVAPVPVPKRVGEPSVFKHVIYIIKENRTYDQVLGDIETGNGAPALCIYGENVTPNQHKLARDFVLLDNTYCASTLSADGHPWADSAMATDYIERQLAAAWPRSYPAGGSGTTGKDALAWSPAGFIWDNALAHGKTVVNFGEYCTKLPPRWKDPARKTKIGFHENYANYISDANAIIYGCEPDIEPMRPICDLGYMAWDLTLPDVVRASYFIQALRKYELNDDLPALVILWLPNDHTSGAKIGAPAPDAMVADNDLAMGKIIEALSHTKYWKDTCVLAIEDDSQNGWDHVSGYRTTAYVVSAYTQRYQTISTQYNQTSLLRTIELILGLPPMNQMDATATPMTDCFTDTPNFAPFTAVPNRVPLDKTNPSARKKIADAQLRKDAATSEKLPLDKADQCDEDALNRILWRAANGVASAYPEWAVKPAPDND